jgi:hypothetical protein
MRKKRIKALLAMLSGFGCRVMEFPDHAVIRFGSECDGFHDFLRKTIWEFKRVENGVEWFSATPQEGELSW